MKKNNTETFNFKFLNRIMYIGAIIAVFYVLQNLGFIDKFFLALKALTPVFIGIIICWISIPFKNKLRKLGLSKNISAIISLILIFGIIILIFSLVIPMFIQQLASLVKEMPNIYTTAIVKINDLLKDNLGVEDAIKISSSIKNLDFVQNILSNVIDYSINTVQSVIGVIVTIGTTIIVSFLVATDIDNFKLGLIGFFSKNSRDGNRYKMITEIDNVIMSYIRGVGIDSVIVGLMTTVVCMILKLDYAIIFGILIMFLNLIPYIGAILSYSIASLYALSVGGPALAAITFISLLIIQIIDANILQPNIIGKSVDLHPVIILSGLIVFDLFFGIVGMIIAVPILSVIKVIIKYKLDIHEDDIDNIEDFKEDTRPKIEIKNKL